MAPSMVGAAAPRSASMSAAGHHRHMTLQEVEKVLVNTKTARRQGTSYFTLEVYARSGVHPADLKPSGDGHEDARSPLYQVQRTIADFKRLRAALDSAAHLAHKFSYCDVCKEMIAYLDQDETLLVPSSVHRLLVGQDKTVRCLEQFINDALAIVTYPADSYGAPLCSGQVQSHQVLHQFLLPNGQDS